MKKSYRTIQCNESHPQTCRKTPFGIMDYTMNYQSCQEDKNLIDSLIDKAENLAKKVNDRAANDSAVPRSFPRIKANCIAGVISEYFWKIYLNAESVVVSETDFEESANQIDLKVLSTGKKIEVRSSFPRNGIEFALCHPIYQFDILGPYSNSYKPGEIQKDFYVRTLFHLYNPIDIITKIKENEFHIYLTGGATWDMMTNISMDKSLTPEDNFSLSEATEYKVIPFSKALDTDQIKQQILDL